MATGAESVVVNGQLIAQPQLYQYQPQGFGPQTVGVPNISPSYPPFLGGNGGNQAMLNSGSASNVGGYGTAGNNDMATQAANGSPFNPRVSPLPWAIAALLIGLAGLHFFHWREVIDAQSGPFKAREETEG
jgi:hypothetical protein